MCRRCRTILQFVKSVPLLLLALVLSACPSSPPPDVEVPRGNADERPDIRADLLARRVHDEVADARRRHDLRSYGWRPTLARTAEAHSRDMIERGYFDHVTPDGLTPADRADRDRISCQTQGGGGRIYVGVSENLFHTWLYRGYEDWAQGSASWRTYDWRTADEIAEETVQGWLDSPSHRKALLDPDALDHGIGVTIAEDGEVKVTQVIC